MRQAGVLAAAALYALDHHIDRLAEDHANARRLAAMVREIDGLTLQPDKVETNIVIFLVAPTLGTAADLAAHLQAHGVHVLPVAAQLIRAVTHLDVGAAEVDAAGEILRRVCGECSPHATSA